MTLSASPDPIWWTRRSEDSFTSWLARAATVEFPVWSVGVWQTAQPTLWKSWNPWAIELAPPGTVADGVGGARKRMKKANFSMPLMVSTPVGALVAVTSFGTVVNWQLAVSSRSVWNSSLVIP